MDDESVRPTVAAPVPELVTRALTARRRRADTSRIAKTRAGEAQPEVQAEPDFPEHSRYEARGILGAGGQGVVYRVHDRELDREAALKTFDRRHAGEGVDEGFFEEARATARLGHPNIVPIFDMGELADGRAYYTMQLVTGQSLGDVLDALFEEQERGDSDEIAREWNLTRLVQVLQQACNALRLAHDRGIIHRDVKPANLMLGEFGEVLLVDWGIAKAAGVRPPLDDVDSIVEGESLVVGTPAYMSPEQICGGRLDARSDVHALGVMLYEILTLHRPHEDADDLLQAVLEDPPLAPRWVAGPRVVPEGLAELALSCLAKDPDDRAQTAMAVGHALRDHVEGVTDQERRMSAAEEIRTEAEAAMEQHREAVAESEQLAGEIEQLQREHPAWQPIEDKGPWIDAVKRRDDLKQLTWTSFIDGVNRFTDALAHVPEHADVRKALADTFWPRFLAAEESQHQLEAVTYRKLVERFHDGRYATELDGSAALHLEVWPKEAELSLHEQVEEGLVLVDGPPLPLGAGDVHLDSLAMGSYVVVAKAPSHAAVRYPVCIERGRDWRGELRLPLKAHVPEGFVFVPGCEAPLGGDDQVRNSWPLRRVRVESFLIGSLPVTFGEYVEFLNAIGERAEDEDLVPRDASTEFCGRRADGTWESFRGVPMTPHFERFGPGAQDRIPVVGVDLRCAEALAAWRSERDDVQYRLPTAEEWELAARGVDRRPYPWGRRFDAALCHVRSSLELEPDLCPVGTFPLDRSIHGVRDVAGCVREWTASVFDLELGFPEVRGSGWESQVEPAAWRGQQTSAARHTGVGFRLASDVESG